MYLISDGMKAALVSALVSLGSPLSYVPLFRGVQSLCCSLSLCSVISAIPQLCFPSKFPLWGSGLFHYPLCRVLLWDAQMISLYLMCIACRYKLIMRDW